MKGLFVDTGGWMACADAADPAHVRAAAARDGALETGVPLGVAAAEAWWRQVDGSSRLRWEPISVERFDKARQLFFRYRDKRFSFTDCTSFVVMQELKLSRLKDLETDQTVRFQAEHDGSIVFPITLKGKPGSFQGEFVKIGASDGHAHEAAAEHAHAAPKAADFGNKYQIKVTGWVSMDKH